MPVIAMLLACTSAARRDRAPTTPDGTDSGTASIEGPRALAGHGHFPQVSPPEPTIPWDCSQITLTQAWELGSGADQTMNLLAPMPGGDMIVVGDIYGEVDFGSGIVAQAEFADDLVIARLRPDGTAVWAEVVTGGAVIPEGLDVSATGRIAVAGRFAQELRFDSGEPTEYSVFNVENTWLLGFVFVLTADGRLEWVRVVQDDPVGLGSEDVVAIAFADDGTVWASGTFDGATATVSYGEPDAIVMTGGDDDPNDEDAFLAHFDANGGLLGVATVMGDSRQFAYSVAPRPGGGADWSVYARAATVVDLLGGVSPMPDDSTYDLLRLDASGALVDTLSLPEGGFASDLAYEDGDLVGQFHAVLPADIPAWDASASVVLPEDELHPAFDGFVEWTGGVVPLTPDAVAWGSVVDRSHVLPGHGRAVAGKVSRDYTFLPDSAQIELRDNYKYSDGQSRPYAIAWNATGDIVCGVDIEYRGDGLDAQDPAAVALDEAGGLWLAGSFNRDILTFESGGVPTTVLEASGAADDTQGYLARWQLWPAPEPP